MQPTRFTWHIRHWEASFCRDWILTDKRRIFGRTGPPRPASHPRTTPWGIPGMAETQRPPYVTTNSTHGNGCWGRPVCPPPLRPTGIPLKLPPKENVPTEGNAGRGGLGIQGCRAGSSAPAVRTSPICRILFDSDLATFYTCTIVVLRCVRLADNVSPR